MATIMSPILIVQLAGPLPWLPEISYCGRTLTFFLVTTRDGIGDSGNELAAGVRNHNKRHGLAVNKVFARKAVNFFCLKKRMSYLAFFPAGRLDAKHVG